MKQSDIKPLFPDVWATKPDDGTLASIPTKDTSDGGASLEKGFPKETMTPLAAGGVPPRGDQMNGILNMLSSSARGREASVVPAWSEEFATAIGGYPATAQIMVIIDGVPDILVSIKDDNLDNPLDKDQTSWVSFKNSIDPVGTIKPWPLPEPPKGWLLCQGQNFDKTKFLWLAKVYTTGKLPDLRGNFIRGFDASAVNDDKGRTLLSWQEDAIRDITGRIDNTVGQTSYTAGMPTRGYGCFYTGNPSYYGNIYNTAGDQKNEGPLTIYFKSGNSVPIADDNRPKNISFNFIVRAV